MSVHALPTVAANRKMHGDLSDTRALLEALIAEAAPCHTPVFVPATLLAPLSGLPITLGGQDCHQMPSGAYTGAVSAAMLVEAGAREVLLGHSERRAVGDTDAAVAQKVQQAQAVGLRTIVCVGESAAERAAGAAERVTSAQLRGSLNGADPRRLAVAYEPLWAIGTGVTPSVEEVAATHAALRRTLRALFPDAEVPLWYGGSVNAGNAEALAAIAGVDGALVGGACLQPEAFLTIVRAFARTRR